MSIPSATQEVLPAAVSITYLAYLSSFPPDMVIGAFAGSVIFLLGVKNKPRWSLLIYFLAAFACGILGAPVLSQILSGILGIFRIQADFPLGISALLSAATVVNVIGWLRDNPSHFLRKSQEKAQ